MKSLSEDVQDFYRLRVIVTFESGRLVTMIYGPYTRKSKAKEIQTRTSRLWNRLLLRNKRPSAPVDPDRRVQSVQYIIDMAPSFGWYTQSNSTYTSD